LGSDFLVEDTDGGLDGTNWDDDGEDGDTEDFPNLLKKLGAMPLMQFKLYLSVSRQDLVDSVTSQ
jgi:hypothetical protein